MERPATQLKTRFRNRLPTSTALLAHMRSSVSISDKRRINMLVHVPRYKLEVKRFKRMAKDTYFKLKISNIQRHELSNQVWSRSPECHPREPYMSLVDCLTEQVSPYRTPLPPLDLQNRCCMTHEDVVFGSRMLLSQWTCTWYMRCVIRRQQSTLYLHTWYLSRGKTKMSSLYTHTSSRL